MDDVTLSQSGYSRCIWGCFRERVQFGPGCSLKSFTNINIHSPAGSLNIKHPHITKKVLSVFGVDFYIIQTHKNLDPFLLKLNTMYDI